MENWKQIKIRHSTKCCLCGLRIPSGSVAEWETRGSVRGRVRHLPGNVRCEKEQKANYEADNSGWLGLP